MTPADELRTAADKIGKLADVAQRDLDTADYWKCYDKATAWRNGFVNGFGGTSSDLVALFTPAAALEHSRWLDAEARQEAYTLAEFGHRGGASPHALAFARLINGGESR